MTNPPNTDQTLDLDAIEARARAATQGPWFVRPRQYDDWGYIRGPEQSDGPAHFVAQALGGQDYTIDQLNEHRHNKTDPYGHNAAHIAGMDPPTTLALTAEVRKLREALADSVPKHVAWDKSCKVPPKTESEIAAVFEPIIARLTGDDIMVFQGNVPRPGYPRGESTERLVAEGLLVDFETNTPLGNLFQSYLNRTYSGSASAKAPQS